MTENEYHQLSDDIFSILEAQLDQMDEHRDDLDFDYETAEGVLTIEFSNGTSLVINKQEPLLQIWVATMVNGHHFDYVNGQWIDNRHGPELFTLISDAATKQSGCPITFKPA